MPWTAAVVSRMKMINNTKVKSTSGVILISLYGFLPWICMARRSPQAALAGVGAGTGEGSGATCHETGRASGRERVCQYVKTTVVAVSRKNKNIIRQQQPYK